MQNRIIGRFLSIIASPLERGGGGKGRRRERLNNREIVVREKTEQSGSASLVMLDLLLAGLVKLK